MKAPNDFREKPMNIGIGDICLDDVGEHLLVNRGEELPYVAFEHPYRLCMIKRRFSSKSPKSVYGFMHSLLQSA